jgi:hypothetical protein
MSRMFDLLLSKLETDLRAGVAVGTCVTELVAAARTRLEGALAEVVKERAEVDKQRAKMLAEVVEERAQGLAEVDARCAKLRTEIAAMQTHQESQRGRVELNVSGCRFQTSIETLRRIPHTFFDAYFSGQYAQDVCEDGSIFVDRDGKYFSHVLAYMRDGHLLVTEPSARPSLELLLALKREFDYFCIELPLVTKHQQLQAAFVIGGQSTFYQDDDGYELLLCTVERFGVPSEQWSMAAPMSTARMNMRACVIAGEIYVTGGMDSRHQMFSSVEKYAPSSDTWCSLAPLPDGRSHHTALAVGSVMHLLGGWVGHDHDHPTADTLKFDSTEGTWSEVAPRQEVRYNVAACAVGSNIFVFGGSDDRSDLATVSLSPLCSDGQFGFNGYNHGDGANGDSSSHDRDQEGYEGGGGGDITIRIVGATVSVVGARGAAACFQCGIGAQTTAAASQRALIQATR